MVINTRFKIGDVVFTIDPSSLKIKSFTVGRVTTWTDAETSMCTLYPEDSTYSTNGYAEEKCFASEKELLTHITTKP